MKNYKTDGWCIWTSWIGGTLNYTFNSSREDCIQSFIDNVWRIPSEDGDWRVVWRRLRRKGKYKCIKVHIVEGWKDE